ncbi:MAG: MerR family transcriptional regulator [Acidobacteria bacterium]|nr:MerR family transcriptional regulator [Acidobacteriota bacterium]
MSRRDSASHYPIRAVSRLTGLGIDTLRAWERRYDAVTPARGERGRVYSEADVRRLRLLRDAVARGHAIGGIARLHDRELETLTAMAAEPAAARVAAAPRPPVDTTLLTDAAGRFDAATMHHEIGRLAVALRPLDLIRDVIMPVLVATGDAWHAGRARVAHEHFVSAIMHNVLGAFLRLYVRADAPVRVLLATPSGERHEFGTLGAAMLAASGGLDAIYLGPDLPAGEIVDSAAAIETDVVILGVTAADAGDMIARDVAEVARRLPHDVELWVGGRGASRAASAIGPRGLVLRDFDALARELDRIGARF